VSPELIAARGLYKSRSGGAVQMPGMRSENRPNKGFSTPGKRVARTECARCGVHLTYPDRG
jgi:hypothetical protein